VTYVHTDHLNTPRAITRPSDNAVIWRWDSDAFGTTAANEDPDGDGIPLRYYPRFPGQFYDASSELHYNYFRDYDPQTGRYVESDPIGLRGGVNTYGYALQNPVAHIDPSGKAVPAAVAACLASPACQAAVVAAGIVLNEAWQQIKPKDTPAANDSNYCPECKLIDAEMTRIAGDRDPATGVHELASRLSCVYSCPSSGRVISQDHFIPPGLEVMLRTKTAQMNWCPKSIPEYRPW
jgi:RHS repeat-associated protein